MAYVRKTTRDDAMMRPLLTATLLLAAPAAALADDTVLGNGTPASCGTAAFHAAMGNVLNGAQARGGTLRFNCGPDPHTIELAQPVFLSGFVVIDGGGLISLSGRLATRHFEVVVSNPEDRTEVTLRYIKLVLGRTFDGFGGAILQRSGSALTLDHVTFQLNFAALGGGAVASEPSTNLTVRNAELRSNAAPAGGGIIGNGNILVEDSLFFSNQAGADVAANEQGGAIHSRGAPLVVRRSRFESNSARMGAAIYKRDEGLQVEDSQFVDNDDDANSLAGASRGSAILSVGSSTLITRSHFRDNHGVLNDSAGGALYLGNAGACTVRDTSFSGNTASFGGTIRLERSCSFDQVTISSAQPGAMIRLNAGVQALFRNATVIGPDGGVAISTDLNGGTTFPRFTSTALNGDVTGLVAPTSGGGNVLHSNLILGAAGDVNVADGAALGLAPLPNAPNGANLFLPQPGSPLLDRATDCPFDTDARGAERIVDGDGNGSALCDTGAVERQRPLPGPIFRSGFEIEVMQ